MKLRLLRVAKSKRIYKIYENLYSKSEDSLLTYKVNRFIDKTTKKC